MVLMESTLGVVRAGAYYDSVVLMQLQRTLSDLPGVLDAGVVMGTDANKELLAQSGLLSASVEGAQADDLVIVVRARSRQAAEEALDQVDSLLARRRARPDHDYYPKSLESAAAMLPSARWVLISVPGRYAAAVGREALAMGKHVFLFSDNVSLEDERALKERASAAGLLVMGPDCGTAIINGMGLGFANRVRRGPIGLVAASGTGLQQVGARIHQLGSGLTHAIGTGGRDLSEQIGAITAHQALDLLAHDPDTAVIVIISKPPARHVASSLLQQARESGKPVVVDFVGYESAARQVENVFLVSSFDEAASVAVGLVQQHEGGSLPVRLSDETALPEGFAPGQRYLRGLYSGGTLAYEAQLLLRSYVPDVYSNVPLEPRCKLPNAHQSQQHTIVDLGDDELTVGRLHPMMDNDLRIRRLLEEASDPEVAVILLDVVLGFGAHPDPATELAGGIHAAIETARQAGGRLVVVATVVGTDEDPQGMSGQIDTLREAGARVETRSSEAVRFVGRVARSLEPRSETATGMSVDLSGFEGPMAMINVGLETFADSLREQGASVVHVDWRPPAGGNERLMGILERMRGR